jgi:hypothetical protein
MIGSGIIDSPFHVLSTYKSAIRHGDPSRQGLQGRLNGL